MHTRRGKKSTKVRAGYNTQIAVPYNGARETSWREKKKCRFSVCRAHNSIWWVIQPQTIMPCGKILGSILYKVHTFYRTKHSYFDVDCYNFFSYDLFAMLWICCCYIFSRSSSLFSIRSVWFGFSRAPLALSLMYTIFVFLQRNSIHMIASPHRSSPIFSIVPWIVVVGCRRWHWWWWKTTEKNENKTNQMRNNEKMKFTIIFSLSRPPTP